MHSKAGHFAPSVSADADRHSRRGRQFFSEKDQKLKYYCHVIAAIVGNGAGR